MTEDRLQNNSPAALFNKYQHLVKITLYKLLGQPHNVARSNSLEFDDLFQYGNLGLWEACRTFDNSRSDFETYAINNIRWSVLDGLNRESNIFKINPNNMPEEKDMYKLISYEAPALSESKNGEQAPMLSEKIASEHQVEHQALQSLTGKNLLDLLNQREREVVRLKSYDLTDKQIAKKFNITPQAINKTLNKVRKKMKEVRNLID